MVKKLSDYDSKTQSKIKKSIRDMDKATLSFFISTYEKKGGDPALSYMKKIFNSKFK